MNCVRTTGDSQSGCTSPDMFCQTNISTRNQPADRNIYSNNGNNGNNNNNNGNNGNGENNGNKGSKGSNSNKNLETTTQQSYTDGVAVTSASGECVSTCTKR